MLIDLRGEPVSTDNRRALDLYEQALVEFHSYVGDPVATIEAALEESPDFVLGHAFRATMLLLLSERRFAGEIRASVESAESLLDRANDRERGLVRAARRWLDGDWPGACHTWESVLTDHPRDAFALQSAHLTDFFLGDAVNLRDRIARVLAHWSPDTPGYSYILGMYAFGLEECNHYEKAEEMGRRALDLEARDGWAVHAVTHVMEMQNRYEDGIEWLMSREGDWAPDNGFAFHNWWHLAVFHLERGEYDRALDLYDQKIYAEASDVSLTMIDASALLWRLHLYGVDTGARWNRLADVWSRKADDENGYYAFNDAHAMMAYLGSGREREAEALLAAVAGSATGNSSTNAAMSREVGLPLCHALHAFHQGRYTVTVDLLTRIRSIANRFGGSHAQRDVISQTAIEAALRGGLSGAARHLVNERIEHKPHSPLAWRFMARALGAEGDSEGAAAARERAARLSEAKTRQAA
ncbi:MAG: tetratricopeptide repeat protein [Gammaproteobacteria bacterium]|nr:tetratricopeptide repeat protein [Gammaproteobacteria bacterium]